VGGVGGGKELPIAWCEVGGDKPPVARARAQDARGKKEKQEGRGKKLVESPQKFGSSTSSGNAVSREIWNFCKGGAAITSKKKKSLWLKEEGRERCGRVAQKQRKGSENVRFGRWNHAIRPATGGKTVEMGKKNTIGGLAVNSSSPWKRKG